MTNNIFNAVVNDFVGDRNGLFRVAGVVIFHANQFITLNSLFGINVFNCLTRAVKFHIAPLGNRADIAPTTATLISSAIAVCEIVSAIIPAMIVFAFRFIVKNPHS